MLSPLEIKLRPCEESDLPQVLEIEQASFPVPWKRELFLRELQNPQSYFWVAQKNEHDIVGYFCCWFIANEGEVALVAVHPRFRRCGIGKILMEKSIMLARQHGVEALHLEVRRSNAPALALYISCGFREVGQRRKYYENGEDALRMVWRKFHDEKEKKQNSLISIIKGGKKN